MRKQLFTTVGTFIFFVSIHAQDFITRWNIPSGQTSITFNSSITLPGASYTWETIPAGTSGGGIITTNTATITGLPSGSIIRLSISPTNFQRFQLYLQPDAPLLLDIEQWGAVAWINMNSSFRGCSNLNVSATDVPNLSGVSLMGGIFAECTSLTGPSNINSWNTSSITDLSTSFYNTPLFNQPLNNWDVSNVTTMNSMFAGATTFNQPLNNWNTSSVINMASMFLNCAAFNQNLSNWNTSNVLSMSNMFDNADAFDQNLSNWDVSNVIDFTGMFRNTENYNQPINWTFTNASLNWMFYNTSAFNQDLSHWDTSPITYMVGIFNSSNYNQNIGDWNLQGLAANGLTNALNNCAMSCENYSNTLIGWYSNPNTPSGITLTATNLQFGTNALTARDYLTIDKGWNISGDLNSNEDCSDETSVGYSENEINKLVICPNPAKDVFTISELPVGSELSILDITGKIMFSTIVNSNQLTINTEDFTNGLYLIHLNRSGTTSTKKLIVNK
jgi:surface protein